MLGWRKSWLGEINMLPDDSTKRDVSGRGTSDRLIANVLRLAGVALLVGAAHAFLQTTRYAGMLWLAGAFFCLGASFDPTNVIRAAIGRVDLLEGRLRTGRFAKGLLYAAFVFLALAVLFRKYLT